MNKEPAVITKGIEELLRAAIPMAILFGWIHWSPEQIGAVTLFVGLLLGFVSLMFTRSQVVPMQVADRQIDVALKMPSTANKAQVIAEVKSQE